MTLYKFIWILKSQCPSQYAEVEFVGIKWQDEHHPSAELFPIDFVDAKPNGERKITVKFITKPRNP